MAPVRQTAFRKGIRDTMHDMVAQYRHFNLVKGGANRIDLDQYLHAVTVLVDHPQQTADLTLDATEARLN